MRILRVGVGSVCFSSQEYVAFAKTDSADIHRPLRSCATGGRRCLRARAPSCRTAATGTGASGVPAAQTPPVRAGISPTHAAEPPRPRAAGRWAAAGGVCAAPGPCPRLRLPAGPGLPEPAPSAVMTSPLEGCLGEAVVRLLSPHHRHRWHRRREPPLHVPPLLPEARAAAVAGRVGASRSSGW